MIYLRKITTLAVLMAVSVVFAGDFGVNIQVDLPLDPAGVTAFVANPIGYAGSHSDALSLSAFVEEGRVGFRFDYQSATEVRAGIYYILNGWDFIVIGHQSTLGLYGGYNWRGDGMFLRLRGALLLYGSF